MQDKLIEAVAVAYNKAKCAQDQKACMGGIKAAIAAVRAHDAGTDACLHTCTRFMCATGWKCSECGDVKPFVKGDVSIHAGKLHCS